jgi:glycosyltransferase involved in cell wall biosynthesis
MLAPDPGLAVPLARFRVPEKYPGLTILTLQFPARRWQDGNYVDEERRRLVREFVDTHVGGKFDNPVQWFYDPMAVRAFAGHMNERLIVYDCMDELSKFACAPPDLIERESELLKRADVVFTGGRKLFETKSRFHDNCHFYGCGVEWEHFGKAQAPETAIPAEMASLPKPRLGYFGVVDERLDYELLDNLARQNPEASIVMVGPVMKVDTGVLPRRSNLHWLGKQAYADLPAFAKAFDVCLMPFALNQATEFINPTKALEYMATGRPVVSTAVADVVRNFGSVVQVAQSRAEFIECCRKAAAQPDQGAVESGLEMARANSWERIVGELDRHVVTALRRRVSLSKAASENEAEAATAVKFESD